MTPSPLTSLQQEAVATLVERVRLATKALSLPTVDLVAD